MQVEEDKTTGEVFLPRERQNDGMLLVRKGDRIPGRREGRIDVKWNIFKKEEHKDLPPEGVPIPYGGKIKKSLEDFKRILGIEHEHIHLVKPFSIGPPANIKKEEDTPVLIYFF